MAIKRQVQGLPRTARRAVAAGAVGAATLSALLLPATTAAAAPVDVPGVGTFDVPDQVLGAVPPGAVPPGIQIPGIAPAPFAPQQTVGRRAADAALSKVGAPYSYGAAGPNAFDCSGLVKWSYEQAGRELPRTSYEQLSEGTPSRSTRWSPVTWCPSTAAATPRSTSATATWCTPRPRASR
ncbi:Probable endopeptidase cgR_2070 precursor [Nocardia africana]|uniref:Probable endopeptidase cgR_2070 n=1 Tax=Nocardia africana TaxID=134964 RepID=A0A378WP14_9NOCA|nr:Probable endopeptidase cgR_2070 precursor [Nocardia africana]